jgi:hypothetical protein
MTQTSDCHSPKRIVDMRAQIRPNLFIIGAMKSGTTSLHAYLAQHPDIFMSDPKEPGYFIKEENLSRGEDWYLGLFAEAKQAKVWGESSAVYSMIPLYAGVPERIFRFNPEARFVYLMRDPFQRTLSHYKHLVYHHRERRDLLTAILSHPPYVNVSNYAMQLRPYFDRFGRQQVYVLTFEELVRNTSRAVGDLICWLGLDKSSPLPDVLPVENVTPKRGILKGGLLGKFIHSAYWKPFDRVFPSLLKLKTRWLFEQEIEPDPALVAETRRYLAPIQSKQIEDLCNLLGRDFPEWTSFGDSPHRATVS